LNLVLSYGDLAYPGGYRTRVLGELQSLDRTTDPNPFLLVFDRNPSAFEKSFDLDIPHKAIPRSAVMRFYSAMAEISRGQRFRIVHAHNLYSAALALSARRRYRYKVVLDYHGRIPEEYVFLGKGGGSSRKALELLESWCVRRADHIIAVSQKLAEYLIGRYRILPNKVSVIPCCTDASSFKWDPDERDAVRQSMNFGTKFVCTHLGSFSHWYDPDLMLRVFKQISLRTDAHLMVVTADAKEAAEYLSKHLSQDQFTVRSAAHSEVPGLLNASDIGLLLLRQSPNIETSSPVKFAEYLNCGLPVLITDRVGDYSGMTVKHGVGAIVARDNNFDVNILPRITGDRTNTAVQCQIAGRELTWDAYLPGWSKMLSRLGLVQNP